MLIRALAIVSVVVSVAIYCAGLLTMIVASAAYQLWRHGPAKKFLRRVDHAAIFLMIAATYTPFAANRLGHGTGPGCPILWSWRWNATSPLTFNRICLYTLAHPWDRAVNG